MVGFMDSGEVSHNRRGFLKRLGGAGAALLTGAAIPRSFGQDDSVLQPIPRRKFGRHDLTISSLALGGHTFATAGSEQESFQIIDEALAQGINFFDNSWDYHGGRSEELMGRAIKGRRDEIFLMTKLCTHGKGGKAEAFKLLEESLRRLGTDHLDLWQIHAVASMEQVKVAFEPGGVVEAVELAKKQGKVRFIGFTGHTDPDVHLAMLAHKFPFDSCQFPLNPVDGATDSFQRKVLPVVREQGIAPLGMKSMLGDARVVKDKLLRPEEALRYALTLPVAAIVSGMKSVEQVRRNAAVARTFSPFSKQEMAALEERCRPASERKGYEMYRQWLT